MWLENTHHVIIHEHFPVFRCEIFVCFCFELCLFEAWRGKKFAEVKFIAFHLLSKNESLNLNVPLLSLKVKHIFAAILQIRIRIAQSRLKINKDARINRHLMCAWEERNWERRFVTQFFRHLIFVWIRIKKKRSKSRGFLFYCERQTVLYNPSLERVFSSDNQKTNNHHLALRFKNKNFPLPIRRRQHVTTCLSTFHFVRFLLLHSSGIFHWRRKEMTRGDLTLKMNKRWLERQRKKS